MTRRVMSRAGEVDKEDRAIDVVDAVDAAGLTDAGAGSAPSAGDFATDAERPSRSERMHAETSVRGRKTTFADILKFAGLIAFFGIMILLCVLIWPYVHEIFEPGGARPRHRRCAPGRSRGFPRLARHPVSSDRRRLHSGEVVQVAAA